MYYPRLRDYVKQEIFNTSPVIGKYKDPVKKLEFVVNKLLGLKKGLKEEIPVKRVESLLLASWNLREFDTGSKDGPRLDESLYYIAEIISAFDLVAIQEIKDDLKPLQKLMRIMGQNWDYMVTDVTEGASGNGERMAFLYDKGKVQFTNMAGEVILPPQKGKPVLQFARSPFLVSFQSGWLKINLCTVHIYYGKANDLKKRIAEIRDLSAFFGKRAKKDYQNYILLGDFNILNREHETMKALLDGGGFKIPPELQKLKKGSNLDRSMYYDQIVYKDMYNNMKFTNKAGVFDFAKYVFSENDAPKYVEDYNLLIDFKKTVTGTKSRKKKIRSFKPAVYKQWKTFQMSDHLPLWAEFQIDFSEEYLKRLIAPKPGKSASALKKSAPKKTGKPKKKSAGK